MENQKALARLRTIARASDALITVPGTNLKFGLDGILGLVPGIGDAAGLFIGFYVVIEAARMGASTALLVRMLGNIALDAIVGAVPVIGDLFDLAYGANLRNVRLIERHVGIENTVSDTVPKRRLKLAALTFLAVAFATILAGVVGTIALLAAMLRAL
ncbi:MAG: DUF4112 domain-containing protein [Deltaproteobacteria bacterium]|nr:DUF4112 domain-containing protein [Deltaproteobacteria bacterium]